LNHAAQPKPVPLNIQKIKDLPENVLMPYGKTERVIRTLQKFHPRTIRASYPGMNTNNSAGLRDPAQRVEGPSGGTDLTETDTLTMCHFFSLSVTNVIANRRRSIQFRRTSSFLVWLPTS
jgi:hypothetical protein